ncbi:efflux RND transporter periplasmic adaptor subunit [Kordia jejudonensis]|uniref:efflux RND transporter periplasmic adaptor subunit n=1 Tax=Kordia jejudonensis TaxID=1348245 RepID=UPI000629AB68|nr:HlyD family efflux transporter periplasmic adaptor subunit [Kordia jejudonensis]
MRKIIISAVSIVLILIGYFLFNSLSETKKEEAIEPVNSTKMVFIETVKNTSVPITVQANGTLVAKNKIELYTEVQGLLQTAGKDFRPGVTFEKGEIIFKVNSDEFYATILAQRSNLQNIIASIMPDLRLDYPIAYKNWYAYLKAFDVNKTTAKLPKTTTDQEELFVTAKNIYNTYYTIKNLEQRLLKYRLRAPFNGIITETNVTKGALIRSGQKIGEFINPAVYELEVAINSAYVNLLEKGKTVALKNLEINQEYDGKITRINGRLDQDTQTVTIFIEVQNKQLREGMYLEANVPIREEANAYTIDRSLLVDNTKVYIVKNNQLDLVTVTPIHSSNDSVIVKGLEDGTEVLTQVLPGAYKGLTVTPVKQ